MFYYNYLPRCFVLTARSAAANMNNDWELLQEDLEELKKAFNSGGVEECRSMLERKLDEWKNIPLNVAVIGNCGVGKSSFINAIRRITVDDEGAAEVGVTETTKKIRSYPHPDNQMMKFWDLPGVGTNEFLRSTYLADIDVDRYDFFLLLTATRFTDNDTWLANELVKRNKIYVFVRTKIGVNISKNKKAHPRTHNERVVLKDIRESTLQYLRANGCDNIPMFLIDSYQLKKFDFEQLEHRLVKDIPKMKKNVLIMSLQATSKKMIHLKVAGLRSRMWKVAALSGAVATVPLPGVFISFDIDLVVEEAEFYYRQLGLDETSLKRYAKLASCDYLQLRSVVDSRLGCRVIGVEGIKKLLEELSKSVPALVTSAVMDEVSRFFSTTGSVVGASLTIAGTYYALKLILEKMESVALGIDKTCITSTIM